MSPEEIQIMMDVDPFALAAKYLFVSGIVSLYALCVFRQKMSYKDAAMAIVGFKKVPNRDWLFNLSHFGLIITFLALLYIAFMRNLGGGM